MDFRIQATLRERQNPVPDIWEQIGYSGSFYDANGNGFDDTYERNSLPAASDDNFDVLVEVYTTRSAALTWTSGENTMSTLILPTTGTSVKIRLPFGSDTELYLQSSPYDIDLPSGELWKSRMRISFAPRTGQTAIGTCIISAEDDISQKVVRQATVITRFPDATASMMMRSLDGGGGDGDYPRIQILEKRFEVIPKSKLFHVGDITVGPFSITNTVNIDSGNVTWSVSHGSMSPLTGATSSLVVGSIPDGDEPIIITAEVELDEMFSAVETAEVRLCRHEGFSLDSYTSNFSPQLGETNVISVTIPGCVHQNDPGWLEIEVMRETTEGWQHVAWIDMDASTPSVDRYGDAMQLPHHPTFFWDGIATEGAASAETPAVFTAGTTSFRRALPQVVFDEPVPPPYYTMFVRPWNDGKNVILEEESRTVYVPQVVKIEMTDAAYNEFKKEIVFPETYWPEHIGASNVNNGVSVELYPGSNMTKCEIVNNIVLKAQSFVPLGSNIRLSMFGDSTGIKTVTIKHRDKDTNVRRLCWGTTPNQHVSWRNERPYGECDVYVDRIRFDPCHDKLLVESGGLPPLPI